MKINYVLVYGTPYLKTAYFETFEDISKYLLKKSIVNYSIYEQMNDLKEVEMIHLENDVRVLEQENQLLKEENKKLKQWDCNKDSRNSRQRVANAKLIKENQSLKDRIEKVTNLIDKYLLGDSTLSIIELRTILKGDK